MKRVGLFLVLSLSTACSGGLEEALLNQECVTDEDCAPSQTCVRTQYQFDLQINGWCRNDDTCQIEEQPGCGCLLGNCTSSVTASVAACVDTDNGDACVCALPTETEQNMALGIDCSGG